MPLTELQPKNQVTLPDEVVTSAGLQAGDALDVTTDGRRTLITVRVVDGPRHTRSMSDLLGAAPGLYGSREEVDAEIEGSRLGLGG